jgi:hypothetical protein
MSTLVLLALIGLAFALQYWADVRSIARAAEQRGWTVVRIRWTPWGGGAWLRSRWERSYRLQHVDGDGRTQRRLCRAPMNWFDGAAGVSFEESTEEHDSATVQVANRSPQRVRVIALSVSAGAFLGMALGIGGSLLLYPSSNIAPAYGLILMTPVGVVVGLTVGLLRMR